VSFVISVLMDHRPTLPANFRIAFADGIISLLASRKLMRLTSSERMMPYSSKAFGVLPPDWSRAARKRPSLPTTLSIIASNDIVLLAAASIVLVVVGHQQQTTTRPMGARRRRSIVAAIDIDDDDDDDDDMLLLDGERIDQRTQHQNIMMEQ